MSTFQGRTRATENSSALAVRDPDNFAAEMVKLDLQIATSMAKSDLLPKAYKNRPENVLIAIGLGRALGLDAAPSLYSLHVIEGTPSPSAKLQQALVRRAGHKFRQIESTDERAVVEIVRRDDPDYPVRVEFTIEDARRAGYLDQWAERWVKMERGNRKETWPLPATASVPPTERDLEGAPDWVKLDQVKRRDNWFTNPKSMLFARATTTCVGQACAEVLSGVDFDTAWDAPGFDDHATAEVVPESSEGEAGGLAGDPAADVSSPAAGSPSDVIDAEVVDTAPAASQALEPDPVPAFDDDGTPIADDTKTAVIAAFKAAKDAKRWPDVAPAIQAESIPLAVNRMTEAQAQRALWLAGQGELTAEDVAEPQEAAAS